MSLNNKFGKIKTIIRKKETVAPRDAVGLLTKIATAHPHLTLIKFQYPKHQQPPVVMVPLTLKTKQSIPQWFTRLTPALELYLNVAIIRDRRLIGNQVEPIHSLTIIGEEQMATLATHYIDTIYSTISRLVASKREQRAKANKKARKYNRRQELDKIPITDARAEASELQEIIILSILKTLNKLLETTRIRHPVSYARGVKRNDYIYMLLRTKYTNSWRSGLSQRYG